jgi:hypothetical protein
MKNNPAADLARARWAKATPQQRAEHSAMMNAKRWKKRGKRAGELSS